MLQNVTERYRTLQDVTGRQLDLRSGTPPPSPVQTHLRRRRRRLPLCVVDVVDVVVVVNVYMACFGRHGDLV